MKFTGHEDKVLEAKVRAIHAEALAIIKRPERVWAGRKSTLASVQVHGVDFLERLEIEFSMRLGVAAGKAHIHSRTGAIKIKLHYRLLKDNDKELRSTYLHELAHILATTWYAYHCGHDENWKRVAIMLGDDGGRCHTMDVSAFRRPVKRYAYKCGCDIYLLSQARHNRAKKSLQHYGTKVFSCKKCKQSLNYSEAPNSIDENNS